MLADPSTRRDSPACCGPARCLRPVQISLKGLLERHATHHLTYFSKLRCLRLRFQETFISACSLPPSVSDLLSPIDISTQHLASCFNSHPTNPPLIGLL